MESAIKNGDLSSVQVFLAEIDRSDVAEQLAKTDDMGMAPIFYAACGKSHVMVRTILDAMHEHLGSEKVRQLMMAEEKNGRTILTVAVCSGSLVIFAEVLDALGRLFSREEVHDMIIFKGAPGKTLLDIAYSSKSVQMWNAVLTAMREKLEPKEVMQQLDRSFCLGVVRIEDSALGRDYSVALDFLSFLLTNSAKPRAKDIRDLVLMSDDWVLLREAWLKNVACADNPFIPGITLSAKLTEAAAVSFEGDQKKLLSFQENVDLLLLEILERLPKTVHGIGGIEACAAMFEPEGLPTRRTPLGIVLEDRGQMETICPDPLVMDYLFYRFTGALKLLWAEDGIRKKSLVNDLPALTRKEDEDYTHACEEEHISSRSMDTLQEREEYKFSECFEYPPHFSRTSLAIHPEGQFIIAGCLAKPNMYYMVPAMRMLFEFLSYVGFLALFGTAVLPFKNGKMEGGEYIFALFLLAGAIREVGEMMRNMRDYKKDHWNMIDLLGLAVVSSGVIVRCVDSSSPWGRSFYALGAPLIFARILFFAQILPFQGPLIQVVFGMTMDLLKFGMVMLVVMFGFVMSFHAVANRDNTFGETWLDVFQAMLGEVDLFDDFSGGPYDTAATLLLVLYLVIITIMLLNLLIAVLSTLHGQAAAHAEREYKVTKAQLITYYRLVVEKDLLPVPFNLVQLVASLPFVLSKDSRPGSLGIYDSVRKIIGYASFWLTVGPFAVVAGTLLWAGTVVYSPIVLYKHNCKQKKDSISSSNSGRVFSWYTISMCRVLVAPIWLVFWWFRGPITWANSLGPPVPRAEHGPLKRANSLRSRAIRPEEKTHNVNAMLRASPGSLEAEKLREYLKNPISDPEVRQDEKKRVATVEHLKLLRDRIDNKLKRQEENADARLNHMQSQQNINMEILAEILNIVHNISEKSKYNR